VKKGFYDPVEKRSPFGSEVTWDSREQPIVGNSFEPPNESLHHVVLYYRKFLGFKILRGIDLTSKGGGGMHLEF